MSEFLFVLPNDDQLQKDKHDGRPTVNDRYVPLWWRLGAKERGSGLGYGMAHHGDGNGEGWPAYYAHGVRQHYEHYFWW